MKFRLIAFRLLSLVALAVCMAMVLDAYLPAPAFCGFRAGCDEVTHSRFGALAGMPLSLWGLFAFAAFYILTLFPESRLGKQIGAIAIIAGTIGLGLVAIQVFVLKQTCPFCLIVDLCAILLAAVELGLTPTKPVPVHSEPAEGTAAPTPTPSVPRRGLWVVAGVLAAAAPLAWTVLKPPPEVPVGIQIQWVKDRINVIEITDFACPHCRALHPVIEEFRALHADDIHFVRIVVPGERDANSKHAALAYRSTELTGLEDEMADALFASDDLSPAALRMIAEEVGINMVHYDHFVSDPDRIEDVVGMTEWAKGNIPDALPQVWINDIPLIGEQTLESLEAAYARASRQK